jgi:uncharacterized protein YbaP (TraB family)
VTVLFATVLVNSLISAAQAQAPATRGFMWEVRKGSQSALLIGTIHVGRPEFYPFPAPQLARLEAIDAIVLEADVTDAARAIAATQKYAVYGQTEAGLETRLPAELRGRIEVIAKRDGLDPTPLWRMKPWMLATVLALFEAAQAGYMPALSVEAYLSRLARESGKPIGELEGIDLQFELFEGASWNTQVAFLDEAVKAIENKSARREINRITQAWETGDRAALERLYAEMRAQTSVGARFTVDTVLLSRHPAMVQRIQSMMADGKRYAFAVGSLHMAGPQGLVELLRARGYTVTPL